MQLSYNYKMNANICATVSSEDDLINMPNLLVLLRSQYMEVLLRRSQYMDKRKHVKVPPKCKPFERSIVCPGMVESVVACHYYIRMVCM